MLLPAAFKLVAATKHDLLICHASNHLIKPRAAAAATAAAAASSSSAAAAIAAAEDT